MEFIYLAELHGDNIGDYNCFGAEALGRTVNLRSLAQFTITPQMAGRNNIQVVLDCRGDAEEAKAWVSE